MVRYLETFYRHRRLLIAPLVICVIASIGWVFTQPRTYQASAKIWFDAPLQSDSNTIATVSASDQQVLVVQELIRTRAFCTEVGKNSPLGAYLRTPHGYAEAVDPLTGASRKARAVLGGSSALSDEDVNDLVYQVMNKKLTAIADGPQIVTLTFDAGDGQVAAGTLKAVLDEFGTEVLGGKRNLAQTGVDFYSAQVAAQATEVTKSDVGVADYLHSHPEEAAPTAIPSATLSGLRRSQDLSRQRYDSLIGKLDQAKLDLAASSNSGGAGFRVIDDARVPSSPLGLRNKLLFGAAGGFLAGAIISLMGLVALTLADSTLRRREEVQSMLGLRVVGSVPRLQGLGR